MTKKSENKEKKEHKINIINIVEKIKDKFKKIKDKEIYISIATFVIYIGLSFLGQMFDFLPFKISESVCAFNTLYSTVEIFVPAISILIFDIVLVGVGVFKRGKFVDA